MAQTGRRRATRSDRVAGSWRAVVLSVLAMLGTVVLVSVLIVVLLGLTPIASRSDAMEPAISRGDLALARTVDAGEIGVGDVVSVRDRAGRRVTHRVTLVEPYGSSIRLTLKADRSPAPDVETYDVTRVDKVVTTIPWVGWVVGTAAGLVLAGVVVAALAVALLVPRRRRRGTRQASRRRV